jgi:ribosomal protein L7/L12
VVGGGTASFGPQTLGEVDRSIFDVAVIDPGTNRPQILQLYRELLQVSPAEAKSLLGAARVLVATGDRVEIQQSVSRLQAAGATLDIQVVDKIDG